MKFRSSLGEGAVWTGQFWCRIPRALSMTQTRWSYILLVLHLWPDGAICPFLVVFSREGNACVLLFRTSETVDFKSPALQEISQAYVDTNHNSLLTVNERVPYDKSIAIWEHRFGLPANDMLHHASNYFWTNYRTGGHYKLRHSPCILSRTSDRLLYSKPGLSLL